MNFTVRGVGGSTLFLHRTIVIQRRFCALMQPFRGPESKNLAAYDRWHAARNNAGRSYLDALGLLLAPRPRSHTTC